MGSFIERIKSWGPVASVLRVQGRFGDDGAGLMASALTYHAFISLFPVVLLGLSITGFVLAASPDLGERWQRAIEDSIPGLSAIVGDNLDVIVDARAGTGVVGVLGLLWTGSTLVKVARGALLRAFHLDDPSNPLTGLARAFGAFALLGIVGAATQVVGAWAGNAPATGASGLVLRVGGGVASAAADLLFFGTAYWVLSRPRGPRPATILRGAWLPAVAWTVLTLIGSWYARRTVAGAVAVYGTFAGAIGLLVILALGARAFMYGAVLIGLRMDRAEPGFSEVSVGHLPKAG